MRILTKPALAAWLLLQFAPLYGAAPDFRSRYLAITLSRETPGFSFFAVDSLGQGKLDHNPLLADTNNVPGLKLERGSKYLLKGRPVWHVGWTEKTLTLRSEYTTGIEAPPFALTFDQKANHATLLGLMQPGQREMPLPCVLHLPDMGSLRITGKGKLDYDARRYVKPPFVRVAFQPATSNQRQVEYRLEVALIYPQLAGVEENPRLRRISARLPEHFSNQSTRADARQQRLQRPGRLHCLRVFGPGAACPTAR